MRWVIFFSTTPADSSLVVKMGLKIVLQRIRSAKVTREAIQR